MLENLRRKLEIARRVMILQKNQLQSQPDRGYPNSVARKYADETCIDYEALLSFYSYPCRLESEKEGQIALSLLSHRVLRENVSRLELMSVLGHPDLKSLGLSEEDKQEFCNVFFG